MASLPEGWEWDYDGQRWFYKYNPTGHIQYHFPQEGDEFAAFLNNTTTSIEPTPEEQLASKQQLKSTARPTRQTLAPSHGGTEMGSLARPVSDIWDGQGDGDDDGVFQPENFMYLGPGAYTEVSPLVEEEEEAAKRAVAGPQSGGASSGTGVSPLASNSGTPQTKKSEPAEAGSSRTQPNETSVPTPAAVDPKHAIDELQPCTVEADNSTETVEQQTKDEGDAVPMLGGREIPFELPAPTYNPVGHVAEMPTEQTPASHIELHPDPVEIGGGLFLAPVEVLPPTGMAELPETSDPKEEPKAASVVPKRGPTNISIRTQGLKGSSSGANAPTPTEVSSSSFKIKRKATSTPSPVKGAVPEPAPSSIQDSAATPVTNQPNVSEPEKGGSIPDPVPSRPPKIPLDRPERPHSVIGTLRTSERTSISNSPVGGLVRSATISSVEISPLRSRAESQASISTLQSPSPLESRSGSMSSLLPSGYQPTPLSASTSSGQVSVEEVQESYFPQGASALSPRLSVSRNTQPLTRILEKQDTEIASMSQPGLKEQNATNAPSTQSLAEVQPSPAAAKTSSTPHASTTAGANETNDIPDSLRPGYLQPSQSGVPNKSFSPWPGRKEHDAHPESRKWTKWFKVPKGTSMPPQATVQSQWPPQAKPQAAQTSLQSAPLQSFEHQREAVYPPVAVPGSYGSNRTGSIPPTWSGSTTDYPAQLVPGGMTRPLVQQNINAPQTIRDPASAIDNELRPKPLFSSPRTNVVAESQDHSKWAKNRAADYSGGEWGKE